MIRRVLCLAEHLGGKMTNKTLLMTAFLIFSMVRVAGAENVRQPAVSGSFYPARPPELREMVKGFLGQVTEKGLAGELIALIVPHAGFVFSGQVAAHSYKQLEERDFDTIILIGDSHRVRFSGVSVGNYSAYRTPLGDVAIDKDLVEKLIKESERINFHPRAHEGEHSLEVQLPFLQTVFKDFKLVPIIMGERNFETCEILADALIKQTKGKNVLFIASTDLSHFHPYNKAVEIDKRAISAMGKLDGKLLFQGLEDNEYELCGGAATVTTLLVAKKLGAQRAQLLKYANSGDVPFGDKSRVVGYAAIAITTQKSSQGIETFEPLSEEAKNVLLRLARQAIQGYAVISATPKFGPEDLAVLNEERGVFVTIYKDGGLRGCIGTHEPDRPLYQLVPKVAINAAFFDGRFAPLTREEIKNIKIELSVYLSTLVKIDDVSQYEVGKHGIILRKGRQGATFLPKVPLEQGWNREETLEQLCRKAGLRPGAWRDKDVEFYIYSTQVFGE
jgi:AmmeMemoRadiSam system protein B/AmmeMemoRadiSam system protein A